MDKLAVAEIGSFAFVPLVWAFFRFVLHREIVRDLVAGTLFGAFIEFFTEPYWDYHYQLTIYRDLPLAVLLGWGAALALAKYVSEMLYKAITGRAVVSTIDLRILITDVIGGLLIVVPMEVISLGIGIYHYDYQRLGWSWGRAPVIDLPYEAFVCYGLLMLLGPTYLRCWPGHAPREGRES